MYELFIQVIETNLYGSFILHNYLFSFNRNSQFAMILLPVQLMTSIEVTYNDLIETKKILNYIFSFIIHFYYGEKKQYYVL